MYTGRTEFTAENIIPLYRISKMVMADALERNLEATIRQHFVSDDSVLTVYMNVFNISTASPLIDYLANYIRT